MSLDIVEAIGKKAFELGFEGFGITAPKIPDEHIDMFKEWLAMGYNGNMSWLERHAPLKEDLSLLLPDVKSVIALFFPYSHPIKKNPKHCGRVSSYAYGKDYHKHIKKLLKELGLFVASFDSNIKWRAFVDSGPLPERSLAMQAGLGFIGKNHSLIVPRVGSFGFLAFLITTLDLPVANSSFKIHQGCNRCDRCLKACPTNALSASGFDSRLCIGYLTVEFDGVIEPKLAKRFGDRIFGCDLCQQACPYNSKPLYFDDWRDTGYDCLDVAELLQIKDEQSFRHMFAGTSFRHAGRNRMVRNAIIVAVNNKLYHLLPTIENLAKKDRCPFVKEQAAVMLDSLNGDQ